MRRPVRHAIRRSTSPDAQQTVTPEHGSPLNAWSNDVSDGARSESVSGPPQLMETSPTAYAKASHDTAAEIASRNSSVRIGAK